LPARDAGAKVTATLTTIDVKLGDQGLAARLWALELLLLRVSWWMATEKLEGQVLVLLPLLRSQTLQPLKFHEGL